MLNLDWWVFSVFNALCSVSAGDLLDLVVAGHIMWFMTAMRSRGKLVSEFVAVEEEIGAT